MASHVHNFTLYLLHWTGLDATAEYSFSERKTSEASTTWQTIKEVKCYNKGNSTTDSELVYNVFFNNYKLFCTRSEVKTCQTTELLKYPRCICDCQLFCLFKSVTKLSIDPENKLRTGLLKKKHLCHMSQLGLILRLFAKFGTRICDINRDGNPIQSIHIHNT